MLAVLKDPVSLLDFFDYAVIGLIILATLLAIALSYIRQRQIEKSGNENLIFLDYLLMGRRLTLPMFTATLVATWYGGIFGVTEIAFSHGVYNFLTQGVFWYAIYLIFAFFLVDRVRGFGAITLPEIVGKMFGPRAEKVAAVFNFFNVLPVAYALSLGLFLKSLLGWEMLPATFLGTAIVCLYNILGGFRADVFTDIVQFFVMCLAVFFVVVFSWSHFGGIDFLQSRLPSTHFEPLGGHGLATTFVWGLIAMVTLIDPSFYQRCFAARDSKTAKYGILFSTLIWIAFDLCTTLGGMYARAVIPEAQSTEAYLIYGVQLLPHGLKGFFLAGIVCTILSTMDSFLFIASNTLTYDLMPESLRKKLNINHLATVLVGCLAATLSLYFEGSIRDVWKTLGSYAAGCLMLPMLTGYFKKNWIDELGFLLGCSFGVIGISLWRMMEHQGFWAEVDDLYMGLLCSGFGIVTGRLVNGFFSTGQLRPSGRK